MKTDNRINLAVRHYRLKQLAKGFYNLISSYDRYEMTDYLDSKGLLGYDEETNRLYPLEDEIIKHFADVIENDVELITDTLKETLDCLDDGTDEHANTALLLANIQNYCNDYETAQQFKRRYGFTK